MLSTDKPDIHNPKDKAALLSTRPDGTGRSCVRLITASISASYHIFSAPEAPAPSAIKITAVAAITGCIALGAITKPIKPVKTTRDMTRGFIKEMKSVAEPVSRDTGSSLFGNVS